MGYDIRGFKHLHTDPSDPYSYLDGFAVIDPSFRLYLKYCLYCDASHCAHDMHMSTNAMDRCCILEGCAVHTTMPEYAAMFEKRKAEYERRKTLPPTSLYPDLEAYAEEYTERFYPKLLELRLQRQWIEETRKAIFDRPKLQGPIEQVPSNYFDLEPAKDEHAPIFDEEGFLDAVLRDGGVIDPKL